MKSSSYRKTRYFLLLCLLSALGLLCVSYIHAYRFTHFSATDHARTDPKNLTIFDKFGLIFTGISNPHQQDTILPPAPYLTYTIVGDKKLESWYMPVENPKGLMLLYHGYAGNKSSMIRRAIDLQAIGYATAIIGFRGSGRSEGVYTTIGFEESKDVKASYAFYQDILPGKPVYLYGTSMGAAAILKTLSEEALPVNGIVLEYPFGSLYQSVQNRFKVMGFPPVPLAACLTYFGGFQLNFDAFAHNPTRYASGVTCPTLYLAGDHDDRVTIEETMAVFNNINTERKALHIFKGGGHESFNQNFAAEWHQVCTDFFLKVEERKSETLY